MLFLPWNHIALQTLYVIIYKCDMGHMFQRQNMGVIFWLCYIRKNPNWFNLM